MRDSLLHQSERILFAHILFEFRVNQAINKSRATSSDCKGHWDHGPAQGDVKDRSAVHWIPSADDNAGHQIVLILVAKAAHQVRCDLHLGRAASLNGKLS